MIQDIFITQEAREQLQKHGLVVQFQKSAVKILAGNNAGVDLKKREPKSENTWSFRLTKKYRALCKRQQGILTVFYIDDHQ